jgi:dTDP-4-amino-4,6-dideoxygalactose transaminase
MRDSSKTGSVPTDAAPGQFEFTYYRGRVALYAILRSLGIGPGDKVIIQAFTCLAVPEAVAATGATPTFVDIQPQGYNIDSTILEAHIGRETKAIVVQHTYGIPADMRPILEIAGRHGLPVVEDCCHTYYSRTDGQLVGTLGAAAFYSFEWGKPMVLGLGGAAVVQDPQVRARLAAAHRSEFGSPPVSRQMRLEAQYLAFALFYRPALYWFVRGAYRLLSALRIAEGSYHSLSTDRAPDFQWQMAPLLTRRMADGLARLPVAAQTAREVVRLYRARIRGGVVHPHLDEQNDVLVRYPLRVRSKARLLAAARKARLELAGWYSTPVHPIPLEQSRFVGLDPAGCPNAVRRCDEVVSLPVNGRVDQSYVNRIAELVDANSSD